MDKSYEKVCPGCGKSTAISEKFCAGCGHQFRTLFHDGAQGGAIAAPAASSPLNDLRSTPVALIVVAVFLVLLLALMLLFNRPAPAPAPAATLPAPAAVAPAPPTLGATELVSQIHSGQTPASVRAIAGEPAKTTKNMVGGLNTEDWYYSRSGHTVQVHFNGNQVVDAVTTF